MNKIDAISEKLSTPSLPSTSGGNLITSQETNTFKQSLNMRPSLYLKPPYITTQTMVNSAIRSQMKPRRGVSLAAIKKYILLNYPMAAPDINNRLKYSIKRYILSALQNGKLVRTKGVGVSGSFRLPGKKELRKPMKQHQRKTKQKGKKLKAIRDQMKIRMEENSGASKLLTKHVSKLSINKFSKSQTDITKK